MSELYQSLSHSKWDCINGKQRNFSEEKFWVRGYAVSSVGFELEAVRRHICEQEEADKGEGGTILETERKAFGEDIRPWGGHTHQAPGEAGGV